MFGVFRFINLKLGQRTNIYSPFKTELFSVWVSDQSQSIKTLLPRSQVGPTK